MAWLPAFSAQAAGFSSSTFAASFPTVAASDGALGPFGIAVSSSNEVLVSSPADGFIYRFSPSGGSVGPATRLNASPILGRLSGLAFSASGRLYAARLTVGDVVELDAFNGELLRVVAEGIRCPAGMARDPFSGDLFISSLCSDTVLRLAAPDSSSPSLSIYSQPGEGPDGLAFAADGTLYVVALNGVSRIQGTAQPNPGQALLLMALPESNGLAVAEDGTGRRFLYINRSDGVLTQLDLGAQPPQASDVLATFSRGQGLARDSQGCLLAAISDRVLRVSASTSGCQLLPTLTASITQTPTPTVTPAAPSPTSTESGTGTVTPTPSSSASLCPTPSASSIATGTATASPTATPAPSSTGSPSATESATPSPTDTLLPTRTPSRSTTATRSSSPTRSVTRSPGTSPSRTRTQSPAPSSSRTFSPTRSATRSPGALSPTRTPCGGHQHGRGHGHGHHHGGPRGHGHGHGWHHGHDHDCDDDDDEDDDGHGGPDGGDDEDDDGHHHGHGHMSAASKSQSRVRPAVAGLVLAPNPAREFVQADFALTTDVPARLLILDLSGATVHVAELGGLGAGRVSLDLSGLAPGVYVAVLLSDEGLGFAPRLKAKLAVVARP